MRSRGEPVVNAKRVLRILRVNGLTLARHTARRPGRTHDGTVVALRSNVRWCSDHLELHCRDGAIVRVLFAIDACDREIMGWSATTAGVSAEMVGNLMIACVERRFGGTKTPHAIEWLSDNGSASNAKQTSETAAALGLRLLFTPVRSPQSNGISEAFVKTLKRDYARLNDKRPESGAPGALLDLSGQSDRAGDAEAKLDRIISHGGRRRGGPLPRNRPPYQSRTKAGTGRARS